MPGPETFPKPQAQLTLPSCPAAGLPPSLGRVGNSGVDPQDQSSPALPRPCSCLVSSLLYAVAEPSLSFWHCLSKLLSPWAPAHPQRLKGKQQPCQAPGRSQFTSPSLSPAALWKGNFGRVTAGRGLWSISPLCLCSMERDHVVPD